MPMQKCPGRFSAPGILLPGYRALFADLQDQQTG